MAYDTVVGTKLFYGAANAAASAITTALTGIRKWGDMPSPTADDIDVTAEDQYVGSAIDWNKYYIPGQSESGALNITFGSDPTMANTLYTQFRQPNAFKCVYPSGATFVFNGYINMVKEVMSGKEKNYDVRIKVSGGVTFTPPSGNKAPVPTGELALTPLSADPKAAGDLKVATSAAASDAPAAQEAPTEADVKAAPAVAAAAQ